MKNWIASLDRDSQLMLFVFLVVVCFFVPLVLFSHIENMEAMSNSHDLEMARIQNGVRGEQVQRGVAGSPKTATN